MKTAKGDNPLFDKEIETMPFEQREKYYLEELK